MESAQKYQQQIQWHSGNRSVCKATKLAIWLIVDRKENLKRAIRVSAKKYGTRQALVNEMILAIFPDNYFTDYYATSMETYEYQSPADLINLKHIQSIMQDH